MHMLQYFAIVESPNPSPKPKPTQNPNQRDICEILYGNQDFGYLYYYL